VNGLFMPRDIIALKGTQVPGEDIVKSFFSFYIRILSVNDLSISKANQPLLGPAPHVHATTVTTNAEQLNHVIKARVSDCATESLKFPFFLGFHGGSLSPGPEISLSASPKSPRRDFRLDSDALGMAEKRPL
jgi:hypothetical protein